MHGLVENKITPVLNAITVAAFSLIGIWVAGVAYWHLFAG